mmetsp:Transcript_13801/g.24515  ORF Transcript_13801/g.24515 Transcript_13801/m.24515 type:complete len:571 (-) Transcript_13801:1819-3531(-)|eukprot:CAMPEP_0203751304 /NCGR_PEP_ID=MMETSP0098-20131031/5398_1 /ASSEMBLY_ACC=CAM_ASM_000208 /TAXON_ID=96639 /ORGANISM=" , Strain NY0313808BC1" /LENGTH=570 /DNA_ID=CAMNT_0050640963 /DNA_START=169 /DNA_END=1881 /DNA_ORIENTATION=-
MGCTNAKPVAMITDKESVFDFLEENVFFKNLTSSQIQSAATKFTAKRFNSGDRIITQGEVSDSLYCVALGSVDFIAEGEDNSKRKIRTMGRHEFFGEFGLIHNTPRTVSVDAVTDCVLLVLTRSEYEKLKNDACMKNLQRWVNATASSIVASGLKEIEFLSDVGEKQLNLMGRLFRCEVVPAGTVIAEEGKTIDHFYILSRGQLVVTTRDELGLYVELTRLQPGSTFGELSLLKDQPRNATITTLEESVLFSLGREEFGYFMKALPKLGEQLERSVNERSTVNVIAKRIPAFNKMNKRKLHLLAEVCSMHRHATGETILAEGGMKPRKFFILTRGSVEVYVGQNKVRELGPGSYFGEVGLVSDSPHSATVKVAPGEDAFMLECSQEDFRALFVGEPAVLAEISLRVLGKKATLEDVLKHHLGKEYFSKFIAKEFAQENIDFWVAVEQLESIARRRVRKSVLGSLNIQASNVTKHKKGMLVEQANEIYKTYLAKDATRQVNVSGALFKAIETKMENQEYDFKMFNDAKNEVFQLMSKDNFSRFQDSDEYQELMEKVGVYEQKRASTRSEKS